MILSKKTLEKLRDLINEGTEYRSGPKLVQFFNELGSRDSYQKGFPSRWVYTDEKLNELNGSPEIDKCIKRVFAPIDFIGRITELDSLIVEFNQYLAFDKWQVVRDEAEITFRRQEKVAVDSSRSSEITEDQFLKLEFQGFDVSSLNLDEAVTNVLNARIDEIRKALSAGCSLSVIFLCGSALEGILLGIALKRPQEFNQSPTSPKNVEGKVKVFQDWTLSNLIDVSYSLGILREDIKKFGHSLRDFRNYIHPYAQVASRFDPDIHTAKICWQVLKAAIFQLQTKKAKANA